MHQVTIIIGSTPWAFLFQKPELADKTFIDLEMAKKENAETVAVADEFGQRATIDVKAIHGFMVEDMEQSKLAHIERALHQARTQARGQQMAISDPVLKNAATMRGPAVLDQMGNGRFPG